DPDVVASVAGRVERLPHALHAALAARDCTLRLAPRCGGGQDYMGQFRRPGQKNVLDDKVINVLQKPDRAGAIGFRLRGVLADDIQRPQLAALHGFEHLAEMPSTLWWNPAAVDRLKPRAMSLVLYVLSTGQLVGNGAHVATALHVVLAAQGHQAGAVAADM